MKKVIYGEHIENCREIGRYVEKIQKYCRKILKNAEKYRKKYR